MNMKPKTRKAFFVINGEALDQETIVRQRSYIEDHVRENMKKNFKKTKMFWNTNSKGNLDFRIEFYG